MKKIIFILLFIPMLVFSQEKISNGNFDSSTDWTIISSGWTIGSGVASFDGTGTSWLKQSPTDMVSSIGDSLSYILRFKIITANSDDQAYIRIYGSTHTPVYEPFGYYRKGWHKIFITTPNSGNDGGIEFYCNATSDAFDMDSVSLMQLPARIDDPFYVATDGDDTNDGSISNPWATWGRAIHTALPGDTVYFRGGIYYKGENENWKIYPAEDYGSHGERNNHISYMGYPPDVNSTSDTTWFISNGDTTYRLGNMPVFDCRYQYIPQPDTAGIEADPPTATNETASGIFCYADFITFKDFVIRNVYQKYRYVQTTGFNMYGSTNLRIEKCVLYNVSGHGFYYTADWPPDGWDSTIFLNNDAFSCVDSFSTNVYYYRDALYAPQAGTWGNGFMVTIVDRPNEDTNSYVRFIGNRAWHNADEGTNHSLTGVLYDSANWMFGNGYHLVHGVYDHQTSGNGWKVNGGYTDGWTDTTKVQNYFFNNIAAFNHGYGYGENAKGTTSANRNVYNNTSYKNGYGFQVLDPGSFDDTLNYKNRYVNNIAYDNRLGSIVGSVNYMYENRYNSWTTPPGVTVTDADFVVTDSVTAMAQLKAPRAIDGSLPDITFLKLASGSDLINAGTDVGLPYNSTAPDLGYAEYDAGGTLLPPVANFSVVSQSVDQRDAVVFTDISTNTPTSWSWTFSGGNPSTSTGQNPTVYYYTPGTYAVSLTATNEDGSDTETKNDYIMVIKSYKILIK